MHPKIIAISGPLMGETFPLTEEDLSFGRESANRLRLNDTSVSRRHCLVRQVRPGEHQIIDLESHNGTFVNDLPVKDRVLEHGDHIRIGKSLFLYLAHEDHGAPAFNQIQMDESDWTLNSTVRLRKEDAVYLQTEKVQGSADPKSRLARDLNTLVKIGTALNTETSIEGIGKTLLESLLEVVPAGCGAVLLRPESGEDFSSVFGINRPPSTSTPIKVSRTVLQKVMSERTGLLTNDVVQNDALNSAESLISSETKSLLVVPLIFKDKVTGAIYLVSTDPADCFDEPHLQLLTAVAAIVSGALERARHTQWLEDERARLEKEIQVEHSMIGESAPMRELCKFIAKVAPAESSALILGESGTGKELVARALHQNSRRAGRPFVAINCAALTEQLLESELFGHERGAFTGAVAQKKGHLEVADGGTVFLDEVGELSPGLQAKLLRVLQEGEFMRVGGLKPIKVSIRIIAATNRDLTAAINNGSFRQDFYYRLNVVSVRVPSLRERREDIPLLARYFTIKYSRRCNREVRAVSREAQSMLLSYPWPGNVRELKNAIEHAVVLGSAEDVMPEDLPESIIDAGKGGGVNTTAATYFEAVKEAKRRVILQALDEAQGNYTEAAKSLGIYATYLHRLTKSLGLKSTPPDESTK